ncbi:MAG: chorismate synthase, partial [Verrucomicrobiota bacterium]
RPSAYTEMEKKYRTSHADYPYDAKYGIRNWQGGGRASARETIGRVAAGAVAQKVIEALAPGLEVIAYVKSIKDIVGDVDPATVSFSQVEENIVRCGDPGKVDEMIAAIEAVRSEGNSIGGTVECVVRNCPAGWGEPVFDKIEADLAKGMMSLPATKGFEIGSGFAGTQLTGKEHNDEFYMEGEEVRTRTNRSGGVQGGITNGEPIFFRIAFKPTATILQAQPTVSSEGEDTELAARGRHDPCVLPRAVPMVEAMTWLVLVDHALRQEAQQSTRRS